MCVAARHKLPAVYFERNFVASGGLISYGPDFSTGTVVRPVTSIAFLRARAGRLAGDAPTKFELVINLKTAKALGLTVPPSLWSSADEMIE